MIGLASVKSSRFNETACLFELPCLLAPYIILGLHNEPVQLAGVLADEFVAHLRGQVA